MYHRASKSYDQILEELGFSSSTIYSLDLAHKVIYRKINQNITSWFEGWVLDIGAGRDLFRRSTNGRITQWISMDYDLRSKSIDIQGDAISLPFCNDAFSSVLCADVLEHLKNPGQAVRDIWRILESGGIIIVSAPFFLNLHEEPYDFFRFSKFGLQELFKQNGFEILSIERTCGVFGTIGYWMTACLAKWFQFSKPLLKITLFCNSCIQNTILDFLDSRFDKRGRLTQGHILIARKQIRQHLTEAKT